MGKSLLFFLIFGFIYMCIGQNGPKKSDNTPTTNDEQEDLVQEKEVVLILKVIVEYTISHGWGHGFLCKVTEVIEGQFSDSTLGLSVYPRRELFYPVIGRKISGITLGFLKRPDVKYGPPEGFKDSEGTYWELIFVNDSGIVIEDAPYIINFENLKSEKQQIGKLRTSEMEVLNTRYQEIIDLLRDELEDKELTKTKSDLEILQSIIDENFTIKSKTYTYECLGIVFGEILKNELGFHWIHFITESHFAEYSLQHDNSGVIVLPLSMFIKKASETSIDVKGLYNEIENKIH